MSESIQAVVDSDTLGKRLRQARKRQGLTQATAASVIGVSRTTLVAIEQGQRRLKASELMKLAEAYGREVGDFVRDRLDVQSFRDRFRAPLSRADGDKAGIVASINLLEELCTNYLELEQITNRPLRQNYPPQYPFRRGRIDQAAEAMAIAERNRLGLGEAPMPALRDILEQGVGLRIFYLPLQPAATFLEIYLFEATLGGCIALKEFQAESAREQCRWSLAHTYAHFLAQRDKPTLTVHSSGRRQPESEKFADSFAAYFLMPTQGLKQRFNALYLAQGKITPADLVQLAHYYGVSLPALLRRLEEMRLIPRGVFEKLTAPSFNVAEARRQLGLAEISEPTGRLPERYVMLAVEAYRAGEISEGELARYLQIDRLEARTIASQLRRRLEAEPTIDQDVMELALV